LDFNPSSPTTGSWKFSTRNGVAGGGGGQYTIEGVQPDPNRLGTDPKIVIGGNSTGCIIGGCKSGGGKFELKLTPLTASDTPCGLRLPSL
jgi:hypothetical protein